jgi:hypothetical protein
MHAGHADADGAMGRVRALPPAVPRSRRVSRAGGVFHHSFSTQSLRVVSSRCAQKTAATRNHVTRLDKV